MQLRGSKRVEVSGLCEVMTTRVGGKPAYRRSCGGRSTSLGTDCTPAMQIVSGFQEAMLSSSATTQHSCRTPCRQPLATRRNSKGSDDGRHDGDMRGLGSSDSSGMQKEQTPQEHQGGKDVDEYELVGVAGDAEQNAGVQHTAGADEIKDMYLTFHSDSACYFVGRKEGDQYSACVKLTPDKRDRSMGPTATRRMSGKSIY